MKSCATISIIKVRIIIRRYIMAAVLQTSPQQKKSQTSHYRNLIVETKSNECYEINLQIEFSVSPI